MRVKLKTWEQVEKELKPIALEWKCDKRSSHFFIKFEKFSWAISKEYIENYFGKELDGVVLCTTNPNFTHWIRSKYHFFHELWFEPEFEDFLKEEEFKI